MKLSNLFYDNPLQQIAILKQIKITITPTQPFKTQQLTALTRDSTHVQASDQVQNPISMCTNKPNDETHACVNLWPVISGSNEAWETQNNASATKYKFSICWVMKIGYSN